MSKGLTRRLRDWLTLEDRCTPATFVVINTDDNSGINPSPFAGTGTLRQAIIDANATPGLDDISFAITGTGTQQIALQAVLPAISEAVTINGFTQSGASPNSLAVGNDAKLIIEIDGGGRSVGFTDSGEPSVSGVTIRGLSIVNFDTAVRASSTTSNFTIEGNFIGIRPNGSLQFPGNASGLDLSGTGHTIGGELPAARNVISASGADGIRLTGKNHTVQNNYIGTNLVGTAKVANSAAGLNLINSTASKVIGNVLSGNGTYGLLVQSSSSIEIAANKIGLDATGGTAIANTLSGVSIVGPSPGTVIGGPTSLAGNTISGNLASGITLDGVSGLTIQNNYIGTDQSGLVGVPNSLDGITSFGAVSNITYDGNLISSNVRNGINQTGTGSVLISNIIGLAVDGQAGLGNGANGVIAGSSSVIGSAPSGQGSSGENIIAFNGGDGVLIPAPNTPVTITQNSIYSNNALGINHQNAPGRLAPVLTRATSNGTTITIRGTLTSTPGSHVLEFFANPTPGGSQVPEGQIYLGSATFNLPASGSAPFELTITATLPSGFPIITATTTVLNDTSNFSNGIGLSVPAGGTASGVVFEDLNGNGIQDSGEPFRAGVTVFLDSNADGSPLGETTTTTNASGAFSLTSLTDVTAPVRIVVPTGFTQTTGNPPASSLVGEATVTGLVFGIQSIPVVPPPPVVPPVVPPPEILAPDLLLGSREFAVGSGCGVVGMAKLYNPDGSLRLEVTPFGASFTGGVRVAAADFTRDGVADLVVGTGPKIATQVRVLDGVSGAELFRIDPFESSFTGGVYVATGDLNGDGRPELIITPDEGGGPRVRVFSGNGFTQIADYLGIEDPNFRGGARASVGDMNLDTFGDLVVAAGFGGGPRVAIFNGKQLGSEGGPKLYGDFFVFESALSNGAFVTVGDLNGDQFADLFAGGGPGGGPRVTVFSGRDLLNGQQVVLTNFFAGDTSSRSGVRVAVKNLDGDNRADLVVGVNSLASARVTTYLGSSILPSGPTNPALDFEAFSGFQVGVFVG